MNSLATLKKEMLNNCEETDPVEPLEALIADHRLQLARIADLLDRMAPQQYRSDQEPKASVGAHVRHVLEHYDQLINDQEGLIDYDRRPRDQTLESCPKTAASRIHQIATALTELTNAAVRIRHRPEFGPEDCFFDIDSTIERELAFLLSHTIHHMAMMAQRARQSGVEAQAGFGVMPSTLRHWNTLGAKSLNGS